MRRHLFALPVFALASMFALTAAPGNRPAAAAATSTWNITVGDGGQSIAANDFFPDSVTIGQGDTIHFVNPYLEIHTVTFVPAGMAAPGLVVPGPSGPPQFIISPQAAQATGSGTVTFDSTKYFNSGILRQNGTADVSFPQQGTYSFLCLVHGPSMSINVSVVSQGAATQTQAQLDAAGKARSDQLIANGLAAASQLRSTKQQLADGSYNWSVQAGGSANEADILQYNSPNITINVGDTVTWTNPTATPHTVTFLDPGQQLPPTITPLPQAGGAPLLELTPQGFLPAGGASYAGSGYTNSGFFDAVASPTNVYRLKFTKPGTYTYACVLHADQGMKGTITVAGNTVPPATSPGGGAPPGGVTAPNTGSGAAVRRARPGGWAPLVLLLAASGAALVLTGVQLTRRPND